MKTIKMQVELEYDDQLMHDTSIADIAWFYNKILMDESKAGLILHSNEIGDEVGRIKVLSVDG